MPSPLHEALIALFRNRPTLAPVLLHDALDLELPKYTEARIESAELNEARARADPELSVLSAMAHGSDPDVRKSASIAAAAIAASAGLDADRSMLYVDLVLISLTEAARRVLQDMNPAKYEFQSDFARQYIGIGTAQGEARGRIAGRMEMVVKLLALRFGPLPEEAHVRIRTVQNEELDAIAERMLQAATLEEALGSDLR